MSKRNRQLSVLLLPSFPPSLPSTFFSDSRFKIHSHFLFHADWRDLQRTGGEKIRARPLRSNTCEKEEMMITAKCPLFSQVILDPQVPQKTSPQDKISLTLLQNTDFFYRLFTNNVSLLGRGLTAFRRRCSGCGPPSRQTSPSRRNLQTQISRALNVTKYF